MTAIGIVYAPDFIVVGVDTLMQAVEDYATDKFIGLVTIPKLFLVRGRIAVTGYGYAGINGRSFEAIVHEFSDFISPSATPEDAAHLLQVFLTAHYSGLKTNFYCLGFADGRPHVFEVERKNGELPWVVNRVNTRDTGISGISSPASQKMLGTGRGPFLTVDAAKGFVFELFLAELTVSAGRPIPDVGAPIDVLILRPKGPEWFACIERTT